MSALKSAEATILKATENALAKYRAAKEELIKSVGIQLDSIYKEIFDLNPDLKQIYWLQYTPYFNDGSPCEFEIHTVYFLNNVIDNDIDDYRPDESEIYESDSCLQLSTFIGNNLEIMETVYGSHAKISVIRNQSEEIIVTVSEYTDHD